MAHDVLIAGALFPDVPSVQFPDSQQQWHSFTDVSDTTAAAADVAQGKQFYDAQGTLTQGTASGGGGDDGSFKGVIERTATTPTLPSDLTSIGYYALAYYTNLALTSLPSGVTSIGERAFNLDKNLALTSLPSRVTTIGAYAFFGCTSLKTLSCDGAITTLGASAFLGSSSNKMQIEDVRFPHLDAGNIGTVFGHSTANNACQKLHTLDLGNTSSLGDSALANCYALQTLVLRKTSGVVTMFSVGAFANTPIRGYGGLTGTIYVPSALIATYKTANNWKTIYNAGYLTFTAIEGSEWEL